MQKAEMVDVGLKSGGSSYGMNTRSVSPCGFADWDKDSTGWNAEQARFVIALQENGCLCVRPGLCVPPAPARKGSPRLHTLRPKEHKVHKAAPFLRELRVRPNTGGLAASLALRSLRSLRETSPSGQACSLAPRTPRIPRETNTSRPADSLAPRSLRSLRETSPNRQASSLALRSLRSLRETSPGGQACGLAPRVSTRGRSRTSSARS